MTEIQQADIVECWIHLHESELNFDENNKYFWAYEKLSEQCRKNPLEAWGAIVAIYEKRPGKEILSNLAAGPLEDLLVYHGEAAIEWIKKYCACNHDFREVLRMVWQNSISDDVWLSLNRLITKKPS